MTDRLDTIKRLAQTDPYWAAYTDGLFDKRGILTEPTHTDPELVREHLARSTRSPL